MQYKLHLCVHYITRYRSEGPTTTVRSVSMYYEHMQDFITSFIADGTPDELYISTITPRPTDWRITFVQ